MWRVWKGAGRVGHTIGGGLLGHEPGSYISISIAIIALTATFTEEEKLHPTTISYNACLATMKGTAAPLCFAFQPFETS